MAPFVRNTNSSPPSDFRWSRPWRDVGWTFLGFGLAGIGLLCTAPPRPGLPPARSQRVESGPAALPSPRDLAFLARFAPSPLQRFTAPESGWIQEVLVAPGQRVAAGEPLLRFWKEEAGQTTPAEAVVAAQREVEKAEREKATVKTAIQASVDRLTRLQEKSQAARQELAAVRGDLKQTLEKVTKRRRENAARYEAWKRARVKAARDLTQAKQAVTEALAKQAAAQSRLDAAMRRLDTAAAQANKLKRLFDLGVVSRVKSTQAESRRKQAETAVAVARGALGEATDRVKAARQHQRETEARLHDLAVPPRSDLPQGTGRGTKVGNEVESAQREAEAVQSQIVAELRLADQLREALQQAEQRLLQARTEWQQAQVAAETPDRKLLVPLTAPCDLVVEDVVGEPRTHVARTTLLLTYREGSGWRLEFMMPVSFRKKIGPGEPCRAKLLTEGFPLLEGVIARIGTPIAGEAPVIARVLHPPSAPTPCQALVRFENDRRP